MLCLFIANKLRLDHKGLNLLLYKIHKMSTSNLEALDVTQPILLVGPSGVGKTYFIEQLAKNKKLVLYSYNCRRDKTLREGRNKLINWVFLKEPCIVWLEGADDLTIEAQSFLRRSLETYSRSVILVLEVRDTAFLADPLRSRCKTYIISHPTQEECLTYLINKGISNIDAMQIVKQIQPLNYRALNVYLMAKNLVINEKSIYDNNIEYDNALAKIKSNTATMIDILDWKKRGLYVTRLVEDSMKHLNLKWWPDMPRDSRGRNAWFHLAYILSKTQSV
jgi:DNA polymerase III delta prime subunit